MTKQEPCCARLAGRLTIAKDDLKLFARRAAYRESRGRDIIKLKEQILEAKAAIASIEAVTADHEAEHARTAVSA